MSFPLIKRESEYTYEDYLKWPDNERCELINGIAYDIAPAPSRIHQKISRELLTIFNTFLSGKKCEVYNAPFDVRLPESNESDTVMVFMLEQDAKYRKPDIYFDEDKIRVGILDGFEVDLKSVFKE